MAATRDPGKIYLSAIREGDAFKIVDQDGRPVAGVRSVSIDVQHGEIATFTANVIDCPRESQDVAHTGSGRL
jgi:hypothetical protein